MAGDATMETNSDHEESSALESMLRDQLSLKQFFDSVWQTSCGIFPHGPQPERPSTNENPFADLVADGWNVLVQLLEGARRREEVVRSEVPEAKGGRDDVFLPLLFKNQQILTADDRAAFQSNLFSAYLDGCSVVINHADRTSPKIAALCEELQKSFPHVYANTYLTPPASQTAPPHADDRDVFIIQLVGRKRWTIYQRIPVPYPYPHEQVGKEGVEVPESVKNGPVMISRTLEPGDVLYMPRGYVHQAQSLDRNLSFHVTVALATHDWSLAGMLSSASRELWTSIIDFRKAVPRELGTRPWNDVRPEVRQRFQDQIEHAIAVLRAEITPEAVHNSLQQKYQRHNSFAHPIRQQLAQSEAQRLKQLTSKTDRSTSSVGREASERVALSSRVRLATADEKAVARSAMNAGQPGLHVQVVNYEPIMAILSFFQTNPSATKLVGDLKSVLLKPQGSNNLCDLTLLSFARQCVELGALAIVEQS